MRRDDISDLTAFLAVAEERSFTRAAARLGTSQSALSHVIRKLEERLGLRLLTRTTRSVAPTEVGENLLATLRPALADIDAKLVALGNLKAIPSGTIRITTSGHAARTILWPALQRLLPGYPDIHVELSLDQTLTDIVTGRFDAGVRLGESVEKDMVSVRIGPDLRMAVVGSPAYLASRGIPETPHDLAQHDCINIRMPTSSTLLPWEFERRGQEITVRVEGQIVVNDSLLALQACADGFGLAYVMEDNAKSLLDDGRLRRVLEPWCAPFPGYHLYFPSRRQMTPAFRLLIDALRYRKQK